MAQLIDLGALRFVYRGSYSSSATYGLNDVVQYSGALYVVTSDTVVTNTTPTTSAPWAQMLPPGVSLATGTLANRPTTFTGNRLYIVSGDTAANNGLAYLDTGSAWVQFGGGAAATSVRAVAASATDVPVRSTGVASQTGNYYEAVTSGGAVVMAVKSTGRITAPIENVTNTYDATTGNLTQVVKTLAGTTVSTTTLTYDGSGNLSTTTEVADGRTVTRTFSYDASGNVSTVTAAIS